MGARRSPMPMDTCRRLRCADQQHVVFERGRLSDAAADPIAAMDDDAERRLVRIEEEQEGKLRLDALRRVLEKAPPRYRDVLTTVYLEEQPIEVLVRHPSA